MATPFEITGFDELKPKLNTIPSVNSDIFNESQTNIPRPIDITPQVVGNAQFPQPQQPTPKMKLGETLDQARAREAQEREAQRKQQAIQGFVNPQAPQTIPAPQPALKTLPDTQPSQPSTLAPQAQTPFQMGTPAEGSRTDQIRNEVFGNPLYDGLTDAEKRQVTQELITTEAKQGIGARAIIKSMGGGPGSSQEAQDKIKADLENATGKKIDEMTKGEALSGLQSMQSTRTQKEATTSPKVKREQAKITSMTKRDENGVAMNDAARFEDMDTALDTVGADPESKKTLYSRMSTPDKKEHEKLRGKVASGKAHDEDFNKMDQIVAKAQRRDTEAYNRKQAKQAKDDAKDKRDTARQTAQTAVDRKEISIIDKKYKAAQSDIDDINRGDVADKDGTKLEEATRLRNEALVEYGNVGNKTTPGKATVSMKAPDGRLLEVPPERVAEMEAAEAVRI